jgi:hypothetical protein
MTVAHSEARVKVAASFETGDEVAVCSGARIEDGRRRHDGF